MKNTPSKLLLALTLCFSVAAAQADENKYENKDNKNKESTKSTNVKSPDACSSVVLATACGSIQKTTCTTTGSTTKISDAEKSKESEEHKNDKDNTKDNSGDRKDHTEREHSDNDSSYQHRDRTKDKSDGYRWEQTNSNGVKQDKVTVCHRSGGANVTITVDDDGWYHGHSKHILDSLGKCEDQDDKAGKYKSGGKNNKDVEYIYKDASSSTTSIASCATGCNVAGVTCKVINTRPSRGGAKVVR
ncbi:MAG: hypothetical protein PHU06_13215 [Gallionella sp.]|nr:hypothetical protein [Gallionella sp.]MDD4959948.1 hypothetical protein [Gallionella sp.]